MPLRKRIKVLVRVRTVCAELLPRDTTKVGPFQEALGLCRKEEVIPHAVLEEVPRA